MRCDEPDSGQRAPVACLIAEIFHPEDQGGQGSMGAAARQLASRFDLERVTAAYVRLFDLMTAPASERACV